MAKYINGLEVVAELSESRLLISDANMLIESGRLLKGREFVAAAGRIYLVSNEDK